MRLRHASVVLLVLLVVPSRRDTRHHTCFVDVNTNTMKYSVSLLLVLFYFKIVQFNAFVPSQITIVRREVDVSTTHDFKPRYITKKGSYRGYLLAHDKEAMKDDVIPKTAIQKASFLVAGTTIGGGFLALPTVTATTGFYPSAVALFTIWGYFLAQSFALVECIKRSRRRSNDEPGISAVAKSVFGSNGEVFVGCLLAILIEATLVSQISRAGMLFPNYSMGCIISALSVAMIVFYPKSGVKFASQANSILTSIFLISTLTVFALGSGIADWSQLAISENWQNVSQSIPTFLQLLVYGEIVPVVCQLLNYETKLIHKAIALGSFMTLCLQILWSGLGISLTGSTGGDAVTVLLASNSPVQLPLFCLAITAILTTILGSYLALLSTVTDFMKRQVGNKVNLQSLHQRLKIGSLITIPAMLISCSSPTIFLKAIDFAGSYPVLVLWGIMPSVMTLVQRKRDQIERNLSKCSLKTAGPSLFLASLVLISFFMVVMNLVEDLSFLRIPLGIR